MNTAADLVRAALRDVFRPADGGTPSEWAARHRVMSKGADAAGRWQPTLTPYLAEIMDFAADPWARRAVVLKSARVGFTEGVVGNLLGWTVDASPSSIAVVMPDDAFAKDYARKHIDPLIRDNPRIAEILGVPVSEMQRVSGQTLVSKRFPGGDMSILGGLSGKNYRMQSIKRMIVDELDGMKHFAAKGEGDPLGLAEKRTHDYHDGFMMVGSVPKLADESRIWPVWESSDQRRWFVPCPGCGEMQHLEWGTPLSSHGVKWDKDWFCISCGTEDPGRPCACGGEGVRPVHHPETGHYACRCGRRIEEHEKPAMVSAGEWRPTAPGPYPGWHVHELMSFLSTESTWAKAAAAFLEAGRDPAKLQTFFNLTLGLPFAGVPEDAAVAERLSARAETWDGMVPEDCGILVAGVDVQHGRGGGEAGWLELLVRGYGLREETWDILHERIHGDIHTDGPWERLTHLLGASYRTARGYPLHVNATMIDSGHAAKRVYAFVRGKEGAGVFASKGVADTRAGADPITRRRTRNADGVRPYTIGTRAMKDELFGRLRLQRPGPGYMHLRSPGSFCNGFDAEYFAQFAAERRQRVQVERTGRTRVDWVQTRDRNEAIDLHVLCQAAYQSLGAAAVVMMPKMLAAALAYEAPTIQSKTDNSSQKGRTE